MKKSLKSLTAFSLAIIMIMGFVPLRAQARAAGWQTLGTAGFSSDQADNVSMCIYDGTPYVAYVDHGYSNKAVVMKYDSGSWSPVGAAGGLSDGSASNTSLCAYAGALYVAYQDGANSNKATVMKWDGESWGPVGSAGFTEDLISSPKLCVGDTGTLYLGFVHGSQQITVMKYTEGEGWSTVGSGITSSTSWCYANGFSMSVDGDTPYVAYLDSSSSSHQIIVKSFNGSSWTSLGYASAGGAGDLSLFADDGTPYVAYQDYANGYGATVMAYTGGSWASIGNPGFTSTTASNVSLYVDGGTPYAAFANPGDNNLVTVMNYADGNWATVGNAGFTPGRAQSLSLYVDAGTPYLAFQDCSLDDNNATAMKYESGIVCPEYVITHGASGSSNDPYYIYEKATVSSAFVAFGGDEDHGYGHSTITDAMQYVTTAVGTGHATLIFGATGTTDTNVAGTLDIGTASVDLGASGSYVLKGSLTGGCPDGESNTVHMSGASVTVDGAAISSTNSSDQSVSGAIYNTGGGSITVEDGTISSTGSGVNHNAIRNVGGGGIIVNGGTISSPGSSAVAIYNDGSSSITGGDIIVNGGSITATGQFGCAIHNYENGGGGDITVNGGTVSGAGIAGPMAAILNENDGDITITGGHVFSANIALYNRSTGNISISGGTVEGTGDYGIAIENDDNAKVTISGTATKVLASGQIGTIILYDGTAGETILEIAGGTITNSFSGIPDPDYGNSSAVQNYGEGNVVSRGGTITGGTYGYGLYNGEDSTGGFYLSGSPSISGGIAGIGSAVPGTIIANDGGETPSYYGGGPLTVYYGGTVESGKTVAVNGVTDSNYSKFSLTNEGCTLTKNGSDLIIKSNPAAGGGSADYTPSRTITVTETSSDLFSGSGGKIEAEANMTNAFSNSVEVKVTDTKENASGFGLGAGNEVYPFDISLYIKGTNTKTEPKDGYAVTISLPVPDKLLDVKEHLSIMHKSNNGTVSTPKSQLKQIDGVWYLVFEATEFSPYALVVNNTGAYDESAGLPYYVDSNGNEVFIGFAAGGKYIAPSGVAVLLKKNPKSFTDTGSHWAKDYIEFVAQRELFNGTGDNKFSPDTGMTRAMFATVIGRLYERSYGVIKTLSDHAFTDCSYDDYYGKYVDWAAEKGIIKGYGNSKFGPGDQVTREQMAAILFRFADFLGVLPKDMDTVLTYPDANTISIWAEKVAMYCQSTGIITGRDGGNFVPQGTATRAEAAVVLERFIKNTLD